MRRSFQLGMPLGPQCGKARPVGARMQGQGGGYTVGPGRRPPAALDRSQRET